MERIMSKKTNRINYEEESDIGEDMNILDVINLYLRKEEVILLMEILWIELLKEQYRRALIATQNRDDWTILDYKNIPKDAVRSNSINFYFEFYLDVF